MEEVNERNYRKSKKKLIRLVGKDLNITGKELMKLLNLSKEDISSKYYKGVDINSYVRYGVGSRSKYYMSLSEYINDIDEVEWETNDLSNDINEMFFSNNVFPKEKYEDYFVDLVNVIDILKQLLEGDDEFMLEVFGEYYLAWFQISNKSYELRECVLFNYGPADNVLVMIYIYHFIAISYNTPIIKTLDLFENIKF